MSKNFLIVKIDPDPLDHDDTFPSTADFTEDAPISNKNSRS